jgi:hypothetical protein|mmetsp:Transcript_3170/g.5155  ORF Transcript_3170/g.5155 Transcript_3170/m.5155 type:complete len:98 (+) Transcript_3170:133-426(+)
MHTGAHNCKCTISTAFAVAQHSQDSLAREFAPPSNAQLRAQLAADFLEQPHITRDARQPDDVPAATVHLADLSFEPDVLGMTSDQEIRNLLTANTLC